VVGKVVAMGASKERPMRCCAIMQQIGGGHLCSLVTREDPCDRGLYQCSCMPYTRHPVQPEQEVGASKKNAPLYTLHCALVRFMFALRQLVAGKVTDGSVPCPTCLRFRV